MCSSLKFYCKIITAAKNTTPCRSSVYVFCPFVSSLIITVNHNECDCAASPASPLFVQLLAQVQVKENIKAPCYWTLSGEFTGDRLISRTQASNAEKIYIWWRRHVVCIIHALHSYAVFVSKPSLTHGYSVVFIFSHSNIHAYDIRFYIQSVRTKRSYLMPSFKMITQ